jgi:hypothetical protein
MVAALQRILPPQRVMIAFDYHFFRGLSTPAILMSCDSIPGVQISEVRPADSIIETRIKSGHGANEIPVPHWEPSDLYTEGRSMSLKADKTLVESTAGGNSVNIRAIA